MKASLQRSTKENLRKSPCPKLCAQSSSYFRYTQETPRKCRVYNHTKTGVDDIGQMARLYTTKVASTRWPLQVFCNILDFSAINSKIVYKVTKVTKLSRRKLILQIIQELTNFNATINNVKDEEAANEEDEYEEEERLTKRKACQVPQCKKIKLEVLQMQKTCLWKMYCKNRKLKFVSNMSLVKFSLTIIIRVLFSSCFLNYHACTNGKLLLIYVPYLNYHLIMYVIF